jgi:di/tricarboxylate transporter
MDLAWLSLAALLAVVIVSCTSRANPGIIAAALGGLIVLVAPWFSSGLNLKTLWGGFPAELFVTLFGVSLLFTQTEVNGTLGKVSTLALALCRGKPFFIPPLFFVLALGLGTAGPGNIAVAGILAPLAMATAERAGIPPLLMALMVGHGAIASTLSPLTAGGIVADQNLAEMGLGGREWNVFAINAMANAAAAGGGYLLLGGRTLLFAKGKARREPDPEAMATQASEQISGRFSRDNWTTLAVVAVVIAGVVSGKAHVGLAALAGAAILSLLRVADEREAFQKLPWSVIVMVCGVSLLSSLLDKTGGTARFAELIDRSSTPGTVTGLLAFVTGIVSIYSSTTGVVIPAFLPMVKELAAARPGSDPFALAMSVLVGGNLVDMSPLSTIGALCVAGAPAAVDRRILSNQLLAWGFAMALAGALFCWAWFGWLAG